jgi:hypothetical protein
MEMGVTVIRSNILKQGLYRTFSKLERMMEGMTPL